MRECCVWFFASQEKERGNGVAGYRWNSSRMRRRLCSRWRKAYMEQEAGRKKDRLRAGIVVLMGAEALVGAWQVMPDVADRLRLVRMEEEYRLEWQQPGMIRQSGDGPAGQPDTGLETGTVYGIRLDPERLEVQFYQQKQLDSMK